MPFDPNDRIKALLWCDRHCCLCGKQCGVFIELHHIDPKAKSGKDSLENAIPLCFECHGAVGHYNNSHPRGVKLQHKELRKRRDQMYERYTSRFVPQVDFRITQAINGKLRKLPDVGFTISHCALENPVKAFVSFAYPNRSKPSRSKYYNGKRAWHLNPGMSINGHFTIETAHDESNLSFCVEVTLEDCWERRHALLPLAYTFLPEIGDWYLEPSPPEA